MAFHCTRCHEPLDDERHKRYWCNEACWRLGQEEMRANIDRANESDPGSSVRRTIREPDDHPTVTMRNWGRR